jgi:hypothetical protein
MKPTKAAESIERTRRIATRGGFGDVRTQVIPDKRTKLIESYMERFIIDGESTD